MRISNGKGEKGERDSQIGKEFIACGRLRQMWDGRMRTLDANFMVSNHPHGFHRRLCRSSVCFRRDFRLGRIPLMMALKRVGPDEDMSCDEIFGRGVRVHEESG